MGGGGHRSQRALGDMSRRWLVLTLHVSKFCPIIKAQPKCYLILRTFISLYSQNLASFETLFLSWLPDAVWKYGCAPLQPELPVGRTSPKAPPALHLLLSGLQNHTEAVGGVGLSPAPRVLSLSRGLPGLSIQIFCLIYNPDLLNQTCQDYFPKSTLSFKINFSCV